MIGDEKEEWERKGQKRNEEVLEDKGEKCLEMVYGEEK